MNAKGHAEISRCDFEDYCRLRSQIYHPPDRRVVVCRLLGEYPFALDAADEQITPHVALDGYWESWVTMFLMATVGKGWRCVDVGANVGYYSLLLSKLAGPEGRVDAFEPNPRSRAVLSYNKMLAGLDNVFDYPYACGAARGGQATLTYPPMMPGCGTLVDPATLEWWDGVETTHVAVEVCRLDDVICGRVDLIKLDAEGSDVAALEGAANLLRQNRHAVVLMEHCHFHHAGADAEHNAVLKLCQLFPRRDWWQVNSAGGLDPIDPAKIAGRKLSLNLVFR